MIGLRVVLAVFVVVCVIGYLHFNAEHRQAQREVIYLKAHDMTVQEKHRRLTEYQTRRRAEEMKTSLFVY